MRNPRAGEFQGKGKNSTCSANPGQGGGAGPSAVGERRGALPHFREHPLAPLHRQQSTPVSEPARRTTAKGA